MAGERDPDEDENPELEGEDGQEGADEGTDLDEGEDPDELEGSGSGDGEGAEDGLDDSDGEGPEEPEPKPTRGQSRHQRLANELREERTRREESDRRLAELEQRLNTRQPSASEQAAEAAAERERIAAMTPEEIVDYKVNKALGGIEHRMRAQQFGMLDAQDKTRFDAKVASHPTYAKYAKRVEDKLVEARRHSPGVMLEREVILKMLIGDDALKARPKALQRQREKAQQTVRRETASVRRLPPGRGNAGGARQGGKSVVQRLEEADIQV